MFIKTILRALIKNKGATKIGKYIQELTKFHLPRLLLVASVLKTDGENCYNVVSNAREIFI
jgi:hypothetical protein